MPTPARWLIKTGLLYLVAALAVGLWRTGQAVGLVPGAPVTLWLPQLHFLTVGWITQLIFGVAFWLFPRPPAGLTTRWTALVWIAYGLLNGGLLLRFLAEPGWMSPPLEQWGLGLSAVLQWTAGLLFVVHFWPRIHSK